MKLVRNSSSARGIQYKNKFLCLFVLARALGVMNDGKLTQFGIRKKENVSVHGIKISRHRTGLRYCDTLGPGSLHHPALLFSLCGFTFTSCQGGSSPEEGEVFLPWLGTSWH